MRRPISERMTNDLRSRFTLVNQLIQRNVTSVIWLRTNDSYEPILLVNQNRGSYAASAAFQLPLQSHGTVWSIFEDSMYALLISLPLIFRYPVLSIIVW